ncbi:MAG TPA: IS21-like element helper ATPase IstB [Bdellovibrionota bacterium]|nr:IS21-like element helper ATPase IstB [Bdellovibrionota bacterium]
MDVETIRNQLKSLRLPTAARELEAVLTKQKKAVNVSWLSDLLERELDSRRESALKMRIKTARFPEVTSLETFDFAFNPEIDEEAIRRLATLSFIPQNRIALFLGNPGTGKTHLAISIGIAAARAGYRVYCSSAKRLQAQIIEARLRNSMDALFKRILSSRLWIIDDWGVVCHPREVAEEIFDLMDRRKQSSAMILTSNRDVEEWPQCFPDPVVSNITIDRIFDRAETILFKGDSYRLKGKIRIGDIDEEKLKN